MSNQYPLFKQWWWKVCVGKKKCFKVLFETVNRILGLNGIRKGVPQAGCCIWECSLPESCFEFGWQLKTGFVLGPACFPCTWIRYKKIFKVCRSKSIQGFESYQQDFEIYALRNGQPMQLLQDWSYVVSLAAEGEDTRSMILTSLQWLNDRLLRAEQYTITIIQSRGD